MKTYKALTLFAAALLTFAACEEYDQQCQYPAAAPKSEIGKKLVENTKYIYSVYSDESWELEPGVEVTELSYLNNEGRSMRTFWYKIDLTQSNISLECITPQNLQSTSALCEPLSTMLSRVDKEGHKAACARASAGADGNTLALCIAYKITDDKEISVKAHLVNDRELIFYSRLVFFP